MTALQTENLFDNFEDPERVPEDGLSVDVDGYEGPLDLLLRLARDQKVDLTRISILALADQYLAYVDAARRLSLELAADYLVMAAWLAYLKSRLLLPREEHEGEASGEDLAADLALRLRQLESMRDAGAHLMALPRLGADIFARGMPEPVRMHVEAVRDASLYDLLSSYAALRLHRIAATVQVAKRNVLSLQDARARLIRLVGGSPQWSALDSFFAEHIARPEQRRTARASALSASLELVREGELQMRQSAPFAPLYIRRRQMAEPMAQHVATG